MTDQMADRILKLIKILTCSSTKGSNWCMSTYWYGPEIWSTALKQRREIRSAWLGILVAVFVGGILSHNDSNTCICYGKLRMHNRQRFKHLHFCDWMSHSKIGQQTWSTNWSRIWRGAQGTITMRFSSVTCKNEFQGFKNNVFYGCLSHS